MDIGMLTVNLMSVLKQHHSADVVTICMLLPQYAVSTITCGSRVRFPFTISSGSSVG
jgi:hypothetical protein